MRIIKSKTLCGVVICLLVMTATAATNVGGAVNAGPKVFSNQSSTKTFSVNGVSFKMVLVEGGTFTMGRTDGTSTSSYYDNETPIHYVTLSNFSIGQTEVTQALWKAVMGSNPSDFTGDTKRPVEQVTWSECQEFITKLNQKTGMGFRLPTEAEWEFAARGGNKSQGYKYSGSNDANAVAWFSSNSSSTTHPVAAKSPNELGIYDMSGNVHEWCQDGYDYYSEEPQINPIGSETNDHHVYRGGSWNFGEAACRVSARSNYGADICSHFLGLRLVLEDETKATSMSLDRNEVELGIQGQMQLVANVFPENATQVVAWTSSDTNIATVDSYGRVYAISTGQAIITAKTIDGSDLSATCQLTVTPQLVTDIALSSTSINLYPNETQQLSVIITPAYATNQSLNWTSSDSAVAIVDVDGKVTAVSVGNATITATTTDGSNLSALCQVTVNPRLVTSVTMSESNAELYPTQTLYLYATVLPYNATYSTLTWSSSNDNVSTVSNTGKVTAIAIGDATITATTIDGTNLSTTCHIVVKPKLVSSVTLNKSSASLYPNEVIYLYANISPYNATNKVLTWQTSNSAVATVDETGKVTALSPGTATITASTTDGSNLSASCLVTVIPRLVTSVSMSQSSASLLPDESVQLSATVSPSDATNQSVMWQSSNTNVATVSSDGMVVAKGVGTCVITATAADGSGKSATCQVTVSPRLATSVTLNTTSASVVRGKTLQLTATVLPVNATNRSVTWETSDSNIATVDNDGKVTGKVIGSTTITATTTDGTLLTASCLVSVKPQCDVNNDGYVDVFDVNAIINKILGLNGLSLSLADVNGDGTVDIFDVNLVINAMLYD